MCHAPAVSERRERQDAATPGAAETETWTAQTADLDTATLRAARSLLDAAFKGEFTERDWEHALGGVHALVREGAELIGHASGSSDGSCTVGGRCEPATSRASPCVPTGAHADTARR